MESGTGPSIVTPEAVVLDFEIAGIGSRILAVLLDWLIIGIAVYAVAIIVAVASAGAGVGTLGIILLIVGLVSIVFGYPIVSEVTTHGRSPGKTALGLRVVTIEGGPVGFRHAVIRAAMMVPDFLLTGGGLAVVVALGNRRNQRLGDLAAGTFVVRDRQAGTRASAVRFHAPYGYEQYAASLDVSSLTSGQYGVIRGFLLRVTELTPRARATLTWRLANPLAWQMNHKPHPNVHPETFLVCVAAAYQQRQGAAAPPAGVPLGHGPRPPGPPPAPPTAPPPPPSHAPPAPPPPPAAPPAAPPSAPAPGPFTPPS